MRTYYTIRETAEICRVHPRTVRRWIKDGALKASRAGSKRVLISERLLERFLAPA